jgi:hypothetical protein
VKARPIGIGHLVSEAAASFSGLVAARLIDGATRYFGLHAGASPKANEKGIEQN